MSTTRPSSTELQQQFEQIIEKAAVIINQKYLDTYQKNIHEIYKHALAHIQKAKEIEVALDLTVKAKKNSYHDFTILSLAFAVNNLSHIDELLTNEFNPNKYQYNSEHPFSKIKSYEAVQLLLKHGVLQKIKEQSPRLFDSLKQSSEFVTLADIRELSPPVLEQEYKELALAKSFWNKEIVEFNKNASSSDIVDQACLGVYNLGVKAINKDRNLLANYNLLPQTYSHCAGEHRSDLAQHLAENNKPYTGQLKTLYVLKLGLDTLEPEVILELLNKSHVLQTKTNRHVPICYPTGAKFASFEAIKAFLELYICHNPKRFDSIRHKYRYELIEIEDDWKYRFRPQMLFGIGEFTGFVPGFGFINAENIRDIYHAIFASEPKVDIFKLLQDEKMKQQVVSQGAKGSHLFVKKLFKPLIGFFSSTAKTLEHDEKKAVKEPVKEYKDCAPGGPSFI